MKRLLAALLSLVLLFSLASCAGKKTEQENSDAPSDTGIDKPADTPVEDFDIQIVPQLSAFGDGEITGRAPIGTGMVNASEPLPETFPVYVNPYPYGQEGPVYEITDELKAANADKLARFLEVLYEDFSAQDAEFFIEPGVEHTTRFVKDSTRFGASADGFSVWTYDYGVSNEPTEEELLTNPVVKAAADYLGLSDPVVIKVDVNLKSDGTEYWRTYTIAEVTGDAVQDAYNRNFSRIKVIKFAGSTDIQVFFGDDSGITKAEDCQVLPYASVLAKLQTYYPEMDMNDVEAEIYYNSQVQPGYYVPCYRFYIKDGVTSKVTDDFYTIVDVLMTESPA